MFGDIGWSELLLIGIVALIVIGPEDLPKMFRSLGRITARARSMAREFSSAMEDAAKSSGLNEATDALKDVNKLTSKKALGLDALDRAADRFEKWDPLNPKEEVKKSILPDPAAAPPSAMAEASVSASATSVPDAVTPAPQVVVPHSVPTEAPPTETPRAAASGKRRLHAVRRADHDAAKDKKGD